MMSATSSAYGRLMVTQSTDLSLARASAEGHEAAFEAIYRRHSRKVYSVCLRMLGNRSDAEDVTQEVFLQLFRKIGTFQGDSALSTWLYRLTVNAVLMHMRRRNRNQRERLVEDHTLQILADRNRSAHRTERTLIDRMALETAISQLPDGYRNVLVLHDIEGLAHEEIGELLGIRSGTSKSQLHKARLKLRGLLLGKHGNRN